MFFEQYFSLVDYLIKHEGYNKNIKLQILDAKEKCVNQFKCEINDFLEGVPSLEKKDIDHLIKKRIIEIESVFDEYIKKL